MTLKMVLPNMESALDNDKDIYDSGEVFHHVNKNSGKNGLRQNPLYKENTNFNPSKESTEHGGSYIQQSNQLPDVGTYYKQNHQILDEYEARKEITEPFKDRHKLIQLQQAEIIQEYQSKIQSKEHLTKGTNNQIRDNVPRETLQKNEPVYDTADSMNNDEQPYLQTFPNLFGVRTNDRIIHDQKKKIVFSKRDKPYRSRSHRGSEASGSSRSSTSRSNPNVIYVKETEKKVSEGVKTLSHQEVMTSMVSSSKKHSRKKSQNDSLSSSNYLYRSSRQGTINQRTNMNNLNFTQLSANIRRSRSVTDNNNGVSNNFISAKNFDNPPSKKTRSVVSGNDSAERNITKIVLPEKWSGNHITSTHISKQVYNYDLKVLPVQQSDTGKHLSGLVFRNAKPIRDVRSTENFEAFKSLKTLDQALENESEKRKNTTYNSPVMLVNRRGSPLWMMGNETNQNGKFYRESKCVKTDLSRLGKAIESTGIKESRNMRIGFYEDLKRIIDVLNQLIQSIPKDCFSLPIATLTTKSEFEKKSKHAIDVYLNIDLQNKMDIKILYIILKGQLKSLAVLRNHELFQHYCEFDQNINAWCLSPVQIVEALFDAFSSKLKQEFDVQSIHRRNDVAHNASISFRNVTKHNIKLNIKLTNNLIEYVVTLIVALNVNDFPKIFNETRKWPPSEIRSNVINHGVHLLAKDSNSLQHKWEVSFLKSRKLLLSHTDHNRYATNLMLTFQNLNSNHFPENTHSMLPVHYIMMLFWVYSENSDIDDWEGSEDLAKRYIDILIGLKRSFQRKICLDFFFPSFNYVQEYPEEAAKNLANRIQDILNNPHDYLQ